MTMQNNIDIVGRIFRRYVDEPEVQTFARKIDDQRPIFVPIAISANNSQRPADCFEIQRDGWLANVTKMPNLVRSVGKIDDCLGEFIMSISEDENFHSAETPNTRPRIPRKLQCPRRQALALSSAFEFLGFGFLDLFGTWCLGFAASGALPALQPLVTSFRVL